MANDWEPKEEHQAIIARSLEFIFDELAELQEALHCPNSFIVEIANKVISEYQNFASEWAKLTFSIHAKIYNI